MTDREILGIHRTTDSRIIAIMECYAQIHERGVYCEKKFAVVNSILRKLDLSLKHGVGPATAMAFSGFSVVLYNNFGDLDLGLRMSKIAKAMSEEAYAIRYAPCVVLGIGQ